jgi:hypothetical protein
MRPVFIGMRSVLRNGRGLFVIGRKHIFKRGDLAYGLPVDRYSRLWGGIAFHFRLLGSITIFGGTEVNFHAQFFYGKLSRQVIFKQKKKQEEQYMYTYSNAQRFGIFLLFERHIGTK